MYKLQGKPRGLFLLDLKLIWDLKINGISYFSPKDKALFMPYMFQQETPFTTHTIIMNGIFNGVDFAYILQN